LRFFGQYGIVGVSDFRELPAEMVEINVAPTWVISAMPFVAFSSSFVMRSPAERMHPTVACMDESAMILMSGRRNAKGAVRRADLDTCPLIGVEPEFPYPTRVSSRTSLLCAMTRTAASSAW
jgi:hypothetical protein